MSNYKNSDIPLEIVFKWLLRDYHKALDEITILRKNRVLEENSRLRKKLASVMMMDDAELQKEIEQKALKMANVQAKNNCKHEIEMLKEKIQKQEKELKELRYFRDKILGK